MINLLFHPLIDCCLFVDYHVGLDGTVLAYDLLNLVPHRKKLLHIRDLVRLLLFSVLKFHL